MARDRDRTTPVLFHEHDDVVSPTVELGKVGRVCPNLGISHAQPASLCLVCLTSPRAYGRGQNYKMVNINIINAFKKYEKKINNESKLK